MFKCSYKNCPYVGRIPVAGAYACSLHVAALQIIAASKRAKVAAHMHEPTYDGDFTSIETRTRYHRAGCECGEVWTARVNVVTPQVSPAHVITCWDRLSLDAGRVRRKASVN